MNSASVYLLYNYITISSVTVQGEHIKRSVKREGGGGQSPGEDTGGQNSDCPLERLTISLKGQQGLGCSICKVSYRANRTMEVKDRGQARTLEVKTVTVLWRGSTSVTQA
jgi:hypothetical protein